ncbi:type II toxin-antitoxin system RelE family toxin [Methylomagnum sp.]
MKSLVLPSFWTEYRKLDENTRKSARKAYRLWQDNPFHPSLHFKCIDREENVWSVRVNRGCRALCLFEDDAVTWFWIGGHDDYERFYS